MRSKRLLVGGQAHLETILLLPSEEKPGLDCKQCTISQLLTGVYVSSFKFYTGPKHSQLHSLNQLKWYYGNRSLLLTLYYYHLKLITTDCHIF